MPSDLQSCGSSFRIPDLINRTLFCFLNLINFSGICDPISHPRNITLECVFEGFPVNCTDVLIAGTQVTSRCDDLQISSKLNSSSPSIKCKENGEWDNVIHDCPSSETSFTRCKYSVKYEMRFRYLGNGAVVIYY